MYELHRASSVQVSVLPVAIGTHHAVNGQLAFIDDDGNNQEAIFKLFHRMIVSLIALT